MKNIALAMSDGGFLASAFSLGTLSYLNHFQHNKKPLLQYVNFTGATSGGSFASIAYTLSQEKCKAQRVPVTEKKSHYTDDLSKSYVNTIQKPSQILIDVTAGERPIPATFWFGKFPKETKTLGAIVATRQFTICYNLFYYGCSY